jgi:hypothetical protein
MEAVRVESREVMEVAPGQVLASVCSGCTGEAFLAAKLLCQSE